MAAPRARVNPQDLQMGRWQCSDYVQMRRPVARRSVGFDHMLEIEDPGIGIEPLLQSKSFTAQVVRQRPLF
jgi:hypothetical protein